MRNTVRKLGYAVAAVLITLALAVGSTFASALVWAATTVLVVPGTGTKDPSTVTGYQENAVNYYVAPTGACAVAGGCTATPVPYLAEFWPIPLPGWGGLQGAKWDDSVASGVASLNAKYSAAEKDSPIVIFGYSQGGTVVSAVKKQLSDQGGVPDNVSFVLIGNASRPNGGLFSRPSFLGHIPFLDVTFGPGTPTNTGTPGKINTTDVAFQYDGVTDFPRYPLNLLATVNALAGFGYVHGKYLTPKGNDVATATPIGYTTEEVTTAVAAATENCSAATYCQISGDTRYVTLPAKILPIMLPLLDLGAFTHTTFLVRPLVDLVSPIARVLIETGYDRRDYGAATPFGLFPLIDPFRFGSDLIGAAVQGVGEAVTGTGDASKFLAPKPTAPAPPDAADTTVAKTPEPSAPQTTQEQAPVLQLVKSVDPKTAEPQSDPSSTTAPASPTGTVGPSQQAGTTEPVAPSTAAAETSAEETSAPAASATEKTTAPTATEPKPETAEPTADEPTVAAAAA
ncbi:PE-PPE domain-containing protein [Tsukamurella ocularis]|uniref:PE-PPE domain-containing protein n=1 Tax=Tsukamurella ocularis TaxID=1970234 RepID=UPI00216835AD|nr:PE-PPE domain-containing protein [Tsukamurella ocularis]MCS3779087.1 hypothetical protein [Tsukamurella ocularis]MCS3787293.1 hypothetical protein [Tsukamurella ocularis]MCS3851770.1 hypothetical protein [Tsukamurella ocularis]